MATAGSAILFSGLTVAVGLLGLYSLRLGNLGSIGLCGTLVVFFAVLYGLTFLPALLAVLGPRLDAWRVPLPRLGANGGRGFWVRLTTVVMNHPWRVLLPVAAALLLLGSPFARIRLAASDVEMLPPTAESRRGEELIRREFPGQETTRILVILDFGAGSPLAAPKVAELYNLSRWLAKQPGRPARRELRRPGSVLPAGPVPDAGGHARDGTAGDPGRAGPDHGPAHRAARGAHRAPRQQRRGAQPRAAHPRDAPARRGARAGHRPHRLRPRFPRPGTRARAAGGGAHRGRHLRRAVHAPAARSCCPPRPWS